MHFGFRFEDLNDHRDVPILGDSNVFFHHYSSHDVFIVRLNQRFLEINIYFNEILLFLMCLLQ